MNEHVEAEWRFPQKLHGQFCCHDFGNFMAILDIQIVASSLNEVQAGMSASRYEVTWVQTVYLIAEIIAIPMSSIVSRVLSTRVYYTMCAIGFTVSSLLCALSWNLESLLVFRGIQGFMGGGMIPTSMTALYLLFPEPKRSLPLVMFGMISTLGPAIGPTIGGWLTNNFSWHWMFLINIIPGIIIATVIYSGQILTVPTIHSSKAWIGLAWWVWRCFWVGLNISLMKAHDMTGLQTQAFGLLLWSVL